MVIETFIFYYISMAMYKIKSGQRGNVASALHPWLRRLIPTKLRTQKQMDVIMGGALQIDRRYHHPHSNSHLSICPSSSSWDVFWS